MDYIKPLHNDGTIADSLYKYIYPTSSTAPKFYGLPKIHKPDIPLRPITSSRGSITYNLSKHLAQILAPIVGKTDSFIKNSVHLVERLSGVKLEQDECILSYDVSALFTSVPVEESLNIILEKLTADTTLSERTVFTAQQVVDLLRIVLTTTCFKYNGDF